jgi:hypothetical protein
MIFFHQNIGTFVQNTASFFAKKCNHDIVLLKKKHHFFRRKLVIIAEICDHTIYHWPFANTKTTTNRPQRSLNPFSGTPKTDPSLPVLPAGPMHPGSGHFLPTEFRFESGRSFESTPDSPGSGSSDTDFGDADDHVGSPDSDKVPILLISISPPPKKKLRTFFFKL